MRLQKIVSAILVAVLICGFGALQLAQAQNLIIENTWGGTDNDKAFGVAVDSSGNIYVTGFTGSFGAGVGDVFLLKYDSAGTLLWQKTWGGGTSSDNGVGVAVDSSGNIYVTGTTRSFGAGVGDVFLLKYDSAGTLLWQKTWGGTNEDFGAGVAVDSSGNIYVTGITISFGAGARDVLLLKYDSAGTLLWQKTWGGTGEDIGHGVAVDSSGNIYVTGETSDFGGNLSVFLLKYDSAGTLLWQKTWGALGDSGVGVAVDSSGNIYVTGMTITYGAGVGDVFLLKYDSAGTLLWQKTWGGGTTYDWGHGVAVDSSGNIYVTGYMHVPFGADDVLLLKYDSAGTLLWQKTWGGTGEDIGHGVAVDSSGNIYVTGETSSPSRTLQEVSETETAPVGTETTPTGTETTPTGTETTPTGTETTPTGSETYAGSHDAFLLVFSQQLQPPTQPVGGEWVPIDKLQLLPLWTSLASTVAVAASLVGIKRIKKRQD